MEKLHEPLPRYWTRESIEELATIFSLPNNNSMQDWAYEVGDATRLIDFFRYLDHYQSDSDIQFTLMDIVLQSLEESDFDVLESEIASQIELHLKKHFSIHAYQIWYWACFDSEMIDDFRISPLLRSVWSDEQNSRLPISTS